MKKIQLLVGLACLSLAFPQAAAGQVKGTDGASGNDCWHGLHGENVACWNSSDSGKPTTPLPPQTSAATTAQALGIIGNILSILQAGQQEREQLQAQKNAQNAADAAETASLLRNAQQSNAFDPWATATGPNQKPRDDAQRECDLERVVGACTVHYTLTNAVEGTPDKNGATLQSGSTDITFTSSAPRCSRVRYFVDNTPYFSLMKNNNTAHERILLSRSISRDMISIEKCETFADKRAE